MKLLGEKVFSPSYSSTILAPPPILAFKKFISISQKERNISNHNAIYMVTVDYMKGMCKYSVSTEDRQVTSLSRCHGM